jgi:hypothetical protein
MAKQVIDFTTSGTGERANTAWVKTQSNFDELYASLSVLGEVVNVQDVAGYSAGAIHTALQTALNANPVVVVPAGSYTLGAKVTIPSNTTLWIMQGATITAANALNAIMFENSDTASGNNGCQIILDGVINGNRTNQTDSITPRGINFTRANRSRIVGTGRILACMDTAIAMISCNASQVRGIRIEGHGGTYSNGMLFFTCNDCVLSDLVITGCQGTNAGSGYGLYSAGDLNAGPTPTHRRNRIERCHVTGSRNDNLVMFDQDWSIIEDCNFDGSTADKGCHASNARHSVIRRCSFSFNLLDGFLDGIAGGIGAGPLLFEDCEFSNNGGSGLYINGSLREVSHCKMYSNNGRGFTPNPASIYQLVLSALIGIEFNGRILLLNPNAPSSS